MPRVEIPITTVAETGTTQPSAVTGDATNDHYIDGGTDILIELKNTSAGSLDATIQTVYTTPGGVALADNVVTAGAGVTRYVLIASAATRSFYQQSGDSNRIYVDVTSNSWEFRVYEV